MALVSLRQLLDYTADPFFGHSDLPFHLTPNSAANRSAAEIDPLQFFVG